MLLTCYGTELLIVRLHVISREQPCCALIITMHNFESFLLHSIRVLILTLNSNKHKCFYICRIIMPNPPTILLCSFYHIMCTVYLISRKQEENLDDFLNANKHILPENFGGKNNLLALHCNIKLRV